MKRVLLSFFATATISLSSHLAIAQTALAPDQNPDYELSRAKYTRIADSVNKWHSTTQHEMYKAIDWLADRREARADRREFRRQLRLEQARWNNYDSYNNGYYHGNYSRYRHHPYRGRRSFGFTPYYGLNFWWR